MRPIIRSSNVYQTRILHPEEWEAFREILDPDMKRLFSTLLLTGMRYAELCRFRDNPEWLDGRFIHLPKGSMLKVKAKQRERDIRLSDMGTTLVPDVFLIPIPFQDLANFDRAIKRISVKMFEGHPISDKTFRKTWESWLVYYYPDKALNIALSQGHTTTTQYEHYLGIPFEEREKPIMRKWVDGWI